MAENPSILSNYKDCRITFHNRLGQPAAIDGTPTIEYPNGGDAILTLENIRPGASTGEFLVDLMTHSAGIAEVEVVADVDITPEGESELRVRVTLAVMPAAASGFGFSLGTAEDKPVEPQP